MASENHKKFLIELFFEISQSTRFEWSNIKDFPSHLITLNYHTESESCNSIIIQEIPGNNREETKYTYLYENSHYCKSIYKEEPVLTDKEKCKNIISWFLSEYGIPTTGNWWYSPYP